MKACNDRKHTSHVLWLVVFLVLVMLLLTLLFRDWVAFRYYVWRFVRSTDEYGRPTIAMRLASNRYGKNYLLTEGLDHSDPDISSSSLHGLADFMSDAGHVWLLIVIHALDSNTEDTYMAAAAAISTFQGMVKDNIEPIIRRLECEKDAKKTMALAHLLSVSTLGMFSFSEDDSHSDVVKKAMEWWEDNKDLINAGSGQDGQAKP